MNDDKNKSPDIIDAAIDLIAKLIETIAAGFGLAIGYVFKKMFSIEEEKKNQTELSSFSKRIRDAHDEK